MNPLLRAGLTASLSTTVQPGKNTIALGQSDQAVVFSTPSMINLMEYAARKVLEPYLAPDEESVGIDVQVKHLSATPPQHEISATATILEIQKNVVTFEVIAQDPFEKTGTGIHRRAIVKTAKMAERISEKQAHSITAATHEIDRTRSDSDQNLQLDFSCLQFFQVEHRGTFVNVQLNRPHKKNAICHAMTRELVSLIDWLELQSEIRVVIFHGAGNNFSAGDDVSELEPDHDEKMSELSLLRGSTYRRLANLTQTTIAAVDGFALGGGFVFAAACDFRMASHSAVFGLPEAAMGWPPNYGIEIIRSLLGRSQAIQMSVMGESVSAQRAYQMGWVQKVIPSGQLLAESERIAELIAKNSAVAIASVKKILPLGQDANSNHLSSEPSDRLATSEFLKCLKTTEAQKSIQTFRQRKST